LGEPEFRSAMAARPNLTKQEWRIRANTRKLRRGRLSAFCAANRMFVGYYPKMAWDDGLDRYSALNGDFVLVWVVVMRL
jgi:hypothetical protein